MVVIMFKWLSLWSFFWIWKFLCFILGNLVVFLEFWLIFFLFLNFIFMYFFFCFVIREVWEGCGIVVEDFFMKGWNWEMWDIKSIGWFVYVVIFVCWIGDWEYCILVGFLVDFCELGFLCLISNNSYEFVFLYSV